MEENIIRQPTVAGQFYPSSQSTLLKQLANLIDDKVKKRDIIACILPHAGYIYSGYVAGQTVSRINIKEKVLMLGPNHTGLGSEFSIMSQGKWVSPLGEVQIDMELARTILGHCSYLKEDASAHLNEHSLEVELPFLQYIRKDFKIVPISFLSNDVAVLKEIGENIASVIENAKLNNSVMMLASSDMTHYEPQAQAKKKDNEAIQAILELNEDKLVEKIHKFDITMCGYAPIISMLSYAKKLGAKRAELVSYQTSGDATEDYSSVVGYAGIIIY